MQKLLIGIFLIFFSFGLLPDTTAQEVAIPELESRVTDLSGVLSESEKQFLEKKLIDFEALQGSQLAVVIIPTTGNESIEQYSMRLAETRKIGREGADDGIILLIAKEDRELRIEVGYGFEGAIPDATAFRIINEDIVPEFQNGDFSGGINAGVDRIIALAQGESFPDPVQSSYAATDTDLPFRYYIGRIMLTISMFAGILILIFANSKRKVFITAMAGFVLFTLIAGFLVYSLMLAVIIASFGIGFSLVVRLITKGSKKYSGSFGSSGRWRSSTSSWRSSSSSSWSSGGSFSSGSSFSGGGGSFGGGGASGSW